MKGKIKTIVAKKYKDRDFFEIVVDLGDDKSRKYSCWQNHAKDLKEGQEIEFTEEAKEYTDNEGMTRTNWKMILPGGAERKPWGGKSPEEQKKISKMAALKAAVDFLKGGEASLETVLTVADDFHAWIEKK